MGSPQRVRILNWIIPNHQMVMPSNYSLTIWVLLLVVVQRLILFVKLNDYEDNVMKSSQGTHKVHIILISPTIDANSSIFNNLKSLDPNDMYSEYKEDTLKDILEDIKSIINEVDEYKEYEKAYYVVLLYWLIKNRHIITSLFSLVQSMKSVPKNIHLIVMLIFLES